MDYKSKVGDLWLKKFKKSDARTQNELKRMWEGAFGSGVAGDTRSQTLKELDKNEDDVTSLFSRPKGTFDPQEEFKKENEVENKIKNQVTDPEKRKKYLQILEKRKRTA